MVLTLGTVDPVITCKVGCCETNEDSQLDTPFTGGAGSIPETRRMNVHGYNVSGQNVLR